MRIMVWVGAMVVLLGACGGGLADPTLEDVQEVYGPTGEVQSIESLRDETVLGTDVKVVRYLVEHQDGRVLDCGAYFSLNPRDEWMASSEVCEQVEDANAGDTDAGDAPTGDADNDNTSVGNPRVGPEVSVEGTSLPPFVPSADDPGLGQRAPSLVGEGLSGGVVAIEPGGSAKLVVFFAQWSDHSRTEVEAIQSLVDSGGLPDDSVELVAVQTLHSPERGTFGTLLDDIGWSVPTLLDDENASAFNAYGGQGTPYYVALTADHEVIARLGGAIGVEGLQQMFDVISGSDS